MVHILVVKVSTSAYTWRQTENGTCWTHRPDPGFLFFWLVGLGAPVWGHQSPGAHPGDALMTAMLDASHMTRERRCTQHPACDLSASGQRFDLTAWCKIGDAHHTDTCQTCSLSDRQAWTRPEHENIELGSVVQIRDVWQGSQLTRQTRWATINQGSCHRIQSSAGITQQAT